MYRWVILVWSFNFYKLGYMNNLSSISIRSVLHLRGWPIKLNFCICSMSSRLLFLLQYILGVFSLSFCQSFVYCGLVIKHSHNTFDRSAFLRNHLTCHWPDRGWVCMLLCAAVFLHYAFNTSSTAYNRSKTSFARHDWRAARPANVFVMVCCCCI